MLSLSLLSYISPAAPTQAKHIVPGGRWYDTAGDLTSAHAGGVIFYLCEYKIKKRSEGADVSVYNSEDLTTWEFHGLALEFIAGHAYTLPQNITQKPKVVYSEAANGYLIQWVSWHAGNSSYGLCLQGLATSDTIAGPYPDLSSAHPAKHPIASAAHGSLTASAVLLLTRT